MCNAGVLILLSRAHFHSDDDDDGVMWVAVAMWLLCCFVLCSAIRLLGCNDWLPGYTMYLYSEI